MAKIYYVKDQKERAKIGKTAYTKNIANYKLWYYGSLVVNIILSGVIFWLT